MSKGNGKDYSFEHLFVQNVRTVALPKDKKPTTKESDRIAIELAPWAKESGCKTFIKEVLDVSIELTELMQVQNVKDHITLACLVERKSVLLEMKQKLLTWAGNA